MLPEPRGAPCAAQACVRSRTPGAARHLRQRYPYWDRHGGQDHFFWSTNDRGVCNSMATDEHFQNAIKILHFGAFSRNPREDLQSIGWSHSR
jgi:hypothetical protein